MPLEMCELRHGEEPRDWKSTEFPLELQAGTWKVRLELDGGVVVAHMTEQSGGTRVMAYSINGELDYLNQWMSGTGSENYLQFREIEPPRRFF
jgi:hypothetical protein